MVLSPRRRHPAGNSMTGRNRPDRTLYEAELELIDPEVRRSRSELERLLHPEFTETGSTGNIYDREAIIGAMLDEQPGGVVIRDFQAQPLAADTAFVTYRSIGGGGQEARRISIWVRTAEHWQLRYHQGTRIPNTWGTIS